MRRTDFQLPTREVPGSKGTFFFSGGTPAQQRWVEIFAIGARDFHTFHTAGVGGSGPGSRDPNQTNPVTIQEYWSNTTRIHAQKDRGRQAQTRRHGPTQDPQT